MINHLLKTTKSNSLKPILLISGAGSRFSFGTSNKSSSDLPASRAKECEEITKKVYEKTRLGL